MDNPPLKQHSPTVFGKIFFAALSLCGVTIAAFAILTYWMLEKSLNKNIERTLADSAAVFAVEVEAGVPAERLADTAKKYAAVSGIRTTLVDSLGNVVFDSDADKRDMTNHLDRSEVRSALAGTTAFAKRYSETMKSKMLYIALPAGGSADGTRRFCVRQSTPFADIAKTKHFLAAEIFGLSAAAVFLATLFSWLIARSISKPIKKLTLASVEFAKGNFDVRTPRAEIAEIETLGQSLTQMSKNLKKRINSLHKRNCELDEIFGNMGECVFICSSDGELRRYNASCAELFSVPHTDAEKPKASETFRNTAVLETIDEVFKTNATAVSEIEIGEKTYILTGIPLPYESKKGRALFVMRDVSPEKRAEQLRREFVAGVSHELKTPITAVRMTAETLSDNPLEIGEPDTKRFLSMIVKESDRMANLVDDMLLLSRVEFTEKSARKNFTEFPAIAAISEAVAAHERESAERRDTVEIDCPEDIEIRGDFTLVQIAVSNLVGNAVRYGGDNCKISVRAERVGGETKISVSDTGMGISRENLARVFERFFRVDKGRSRALGGTGLGLAVVKHIAILHGGRAEAQSELGKGSIFTITFKD